MFFYFFLKFFDENQLFFIIFAQMLLQTKVEIHKASFEITPTDRLLFVGSCFADNIGKRFSDNKFRAVTNPYGVMYNPASVMHTIDKVNENFDVAVFTLGTNHVYILKETGEIVDNCMKRPQRLFEERELTVDECEAYLRKAVQKLRERNADVKVVITVSPIRYAKYGYHGSRLSKATLLLAAEKMVKDGEVEYFPAYEIMNDELRDYRFYEPDMLHPSAQAVDYIYERFKELFFSKDATQMEKEWQPISQALKHRPFNPDSEEYRAFLEKAKNDEQRFIEKWRL